MSARSMLSVRWFSATEIPAATEKELEAGRAEWGLKYDDECLKFEKEWKIVADRV